MRLTINNILYLTRNTQRVVFRSQKDRSLARIVLKKAIKVRHLLLGRKAAEACLLELICPIKKETIDQDGAIQEVRARQVGSPHQKCKT